MRPTPDPRLDRFRLPANDRCWWCGDAATTREHKYKRSDLKRMALTEAGIVDAGQLFKGSDAYTGVLKSINKGSAVQWGKSMCARCNGARSQPFDLAYEKLSDYLWQHHDNLSHQSTLDLKRVFGPAWRVEARDAARYLAKQMACALTDQRLPLPDKLIEFLDGDMYCSDVAFALSRDQTTRDAHEIARRDGQDLRGYWLPAMPAYASGDRLTGAVFTYSVGFIDLQALWFVDSGKRPSFFEARRTRLPLLGEPIPTELAEEMERRHQLHQP